MSADDEVRSYRRGPILYTFDGSRHHLPRLEPAPGWVYLVSSPLADERRPCCYRCVVDLDRQHIGRARVHWRDDPPAEGERCPRCERPYGTRETSE